MVGKVKNQNTDATGSQSDQKPNLKNRLSAASKGKKDRMMQLSLKLRAVLVNTPADSHGMVPDTPFSQSGVVRMMDLLNQRAEKSGANGSKVAARMLKLLEPKDEKDPAIAGVSVERLQILNKRIGKVHDLSISKSVRGNSS